MALTIFLIYLVAFYQRINIILLFIVVTLTYLINQFARRKYFI